MTFTAANIPPPPPPPLGRIGENGQGNRYTKVVESRAVVLLLYWRMPFQNVRKLDNPDLSNRRSAWSLNEHTISDLSKHCNSPTPPTDFTFGWTV